MLLIFDLNEQLQTVLKNDGTACPYSEPIHSEKQTGENTFTFSVPANHPDAQYVTEGNLVAFKDLDDDWQLFEIKRIVDLHGDGLTRTVHCEHAMYELYDDFIEDRRPTNVSANFALTQALSGTRWSVGTVHDLGLNSTNYYYESALSSVQKVASVWKGELKFRVVVSGGVISTRYVDLLVRRGADTGKQFEYGRHTSEIEREVDLTTVATALYGRGKGVEVGEGYGRRLNFADVEWSVANGDPVNKPLGQEWVGDPGALTKWGRKVSRHRFSYFDDAEETDPAVLLRKTWNALQERKNPRATYKMTVFDLERLSGYSHEKVRLGDTVRGIDRLFSPPLLVAARVIEISRDLVRPENTKITLGNFAPSLADNAIVQKEVIQTVRDRQGVWDSGGTPCVGPVPTDWLDGIIDVLTNQLKSTTSNWHTDENGNLVFETQDGKAAMMLTGNGFMLSNEKDLVTEEWIWRTFGTGDGFTADEFNAGKIRTNLVQIIGNTNFYWDSDYLYMTNPNDLNQQIRLSKEGIRFTKDGGQTWGVAIDFDGIRMLGKSTDGHTSYEGDGTKVYDGAGNLVGHLGSFQSPGAQVATFTRASTAYDSLGNQVTSGVPRYEYMRQPAPVWQDLFDADQLASQYTSTGSTQATWLVSGGVLTGTGGAQATLIKNDLLMQDCEIELTCDQAMNGGISARVQDDNNMYFLRIEDNSGTQEPGTVAIRKFVNGSVTALQTASINWPRGTQKKFIFSLHGTVLEAYVDGVKVISVTDTTFSGGVVGPRSNSGVTGATQRYLDFSVYSVQRGVRIEEGTTNLLTVNQASVETDLNGIIGGGQYATNIVRDNSEKYAGAASAKLTSTYSGTHVAWIILDSPRVAVTPGQVYTFSSFLKASAANDRSIGMAIRWIDANVNTIYDSRVDYIVGGAWRRYAVTATAPANAATVQVIVFFINCLQGETIWYDCGQFEQKPHATSWQLPGTARVAEVLTAPTANVLNVPEGEISLDIYIDPNGVHSTSHTWCMPFAVATIQASPYQEQNKISFRKVDASKEWLVDFSNASGSSHGVTLGTLTTPGIYRITAAWKSGVGGYAYLNGVLKGSVPAANLPSSFAATMVIGSWDTSGNLPVSSPISNFRVRNTMRSGAEILAEYNSGLPLQPDDATTLLMGMDGTLQTTARDFGLYTRNGRFILQDPKTGQGFEVWDGETLKVLIGLLSSGKIGIRVNGGEIYSTEIRTGAEGARDYVGLGVGGSNRFEVVYNNKKVLETLANSGQGHLVFYEDGVQRGRIFAGGQSDPTFYIEAKDGSGAKRLYLQGSLIEVFARNGINLEPGSGYVGVLGEFHVIGGPKDCAEQTTNYGMRLLAARESPEIRYVDEEKATLTNGECTISIDPIFLECIEPDTEDTPWLIHLTPYADVSLYIAEVGVDYFVVKERNNGTSNSVFAWSFSAIRKNFANIRLREMLDYEFIGK